jgi:hypothetical protein
MSTDGERAARLAQTRKRSKVLSPEQRKTRRARARAKYVANGSSEERAKQAARQQARRAKLSPEARAAETARQSGQQRAQWAKRSAEERVAMRVRARYVARRGIMPVE